MPARCRGVASAGARICEETHPPSEGQAECLVQMAYSRSRPCETLKPPGEGPARGAVWASRCRRNTFPAKSGGFMDANSRTAASPSCGEANFSPSWRAEEFSESGLICLTSACPRRCGRSRPASSMVCPQNRQASRRCGMPGLVGNAAGSSALLHKRTPPNGLMFAERPWPL